jgi:hypothetical protein
MMKDNSEHTDDDDVATSILVYIICRTGILVKTLIMPWLNVLKVSLRLMFT